MKIAIKSFDELSRDELYAILKLRSEVFVVEQQCVYQDIDGKDQMALHVIGKDAGKIIAYSRVFAPGEYFEIASIGRVVVSIAQRNQKYGYEIVKASINAIQNHFHTSDICISAQCYLEKFYADLGFQATGNKYLEDGIPHMTMLYKK
ncbi:ElaA protein [Balneicella halophila]|uniref:ElaA protein n=1 Tax=Balneicella halophila TaxID=1537566 RepID=A0A7L4UN93_BALHA|nr:GNAT family N-acetyltransferase [Balneicella halophila]PVX50012.1 ElaA protein [Balneicella halophila]